MSVWSKQDLRNLNSRYLFSFVAYPDFHRDSWYFTGKAEAITTPELFVPGRASTAALCLQNLATWWPKPDHGPSPGVPWVRKVSWEEEIKVRVCVIVPPRDVLTELDEIIHSKHSFCRKCLFFFLISKIFCGKCPISTTILGFSLRKKKLEKCALFLATEFGKIPKQSQKPETPNCFGLWPKSFHFLIARNQTFFSFYFFNENPQTSAERNPLR